MKVLAFDPDSNAIGYALLTGPAWSDCLEAGVIKPSRRAGQNNAIDRGRRMSREALALALKHEPDELVIETPSAQAPAGAAWRGQGDYGLAVGVLIGRLEQSFILEAHCVPADRWTRRTSKAHRARLLQMQWPHLDLTDDPELHMADAIELGIWWLREQAIRERIDS